MNTPRLRQSLMTCASIATLILPALSAHAQGTPPKPKISAKQAEAAAVKKLGGKVLSSKYEFEDGRWQYAVIVQNAKGMYEAEVNATTGKILDTEKTSAAEEAKEEAEDKKKAAGKAHGSKMKSASEKGEKGEADEKGEKPD